MKLHYLAQFFAIICLGLLLLNLSVRADPPIAGTAKEFFVPWELPKAKQHFSADQLCVEPLDVIRSQHGTLLKKQRDATMRQGIRTTQHSLVGCIDCHVTPDATGHFPDIKTQAHFCNSCHTYAAVSVDCFDCHATKPAAHSNKIADPQ